MLTRAKHKLITADLGSDRLQLAAPHQLLGRVTQPRISETGPRLVSHWRFSPSLYYAGYIGQHLVLHQRAAHLRDRSPSGLPLAVLPKLCVRWLYWSTPCPASQNHASPRQFSIWSSTGGSPLNFVCAGYILFPSTIHFVYSVLD